MKRLIVVTLLSVVTLFVSGCQPTPQAPKKPIIDKNLPTLTQIKFLTDITEIGFEWKPVLNENIGGYYVYRTEANGAKKLERVATISDRYASHYVDTKLKPNSVYFYRFSVFSTNGRESIPSKTIKVKTNPMIESVSFIKAIRGLPHRVKLVWRPHPSPRVKSYIVEKSNFSVIEWKTIATIDGRLNAEYIDSGLKDNKTFKYRVRVKTFDGLVSKPSKVVQAGTKPLPPVVENLKASYNLPKKILLTWDPTSDKDFAYYKVYRAINPLLFYSYIAKTKDTKYEDLINKNGESYYYYVTMVDKDGLESPRQKTSVAGATLAAPFPAYIVSSGFDGSKIEISWEPKDNRAVKFEVIKEYGNKKKIFTNIRKKSFVDYDVKRGVEYTYKVVAIDKYGLASNESEKVVIAIPKN